jgi:predicted CXXCH cytochrome family protein
MKKVLIVTLALVVTLMAASAAMAAVAGSKHDLTNGNTAAAALRATAASTLSSCQFCHTPHRALSVAYTPLWNKALSSMSYTLYTAVTVTVVIGQPGANSLACLSCHDGSLSVGNVLVGGNQAMEGSDQTGGAMNNAVYAVAANGLQDDHPIGFEVDPNQAGLDTIANMEGKHFKFYATGGGTKHMECATCHEPHGGGVNTEFLRVSKVTLCSSCHITK